jgi:N-acetyltransferase
MDLTPMTLENAAVRLEPLQEAHREPLRALSGDPGLWEWTSVRGDGAHFDPWFDAMLAAHGAGTQISHAVRAKADGAVAGHTAFLAIAPEQARVEVGCTWYGAPWRGGVVNPACKRLMLGRAFEAGAERVELKTHGRNLRSQRAMEKMGAVREGALRGHMKTWRGDRRDTVYFSVLRDEWPGVRDGLDARLTALA